MGNDRLLLVMPYPQIVSKALATGFEVYSIWDPSLESPEYLEEVAEFSAELILADFADEAQLRRVVTETAVRHDVAYVLHIGRESTQHVVCEAAEALGLSLNAPDSLRQINDKAAMRGLLRAHGLSPMFSIEVRSPAEAQRILGDGLDLPVVGKPTRLDGSEAVRLIEHPRDLDAWTDELAACGYTGPLLIEECLRGPEFSVETVTVHGRHHVVGITAKRLGPPPRFVEMGHVHPARLPDVDRVAITELVIAFLDAADYRFGPAHTEIILTRAGPRIVESQARIGGDRIPLLVAIATGFDVEAAVFRALAGERLEPGQADGIGCVWFFDFGVGRVRSVGGLDEVRRLPFVHALKLKVAAGDVLTPVTNSRTRHGYVVIAAASEQEADEHLATVRTRLHVDIDVEPDRWDERTPAGPRQLIFK